MAAIVNFVGWRHTSRDSTPCNWNTWRYLLFAAIIGSAAVPTVSAKSRNAYCFSVSTEPPKRLLDHHIFVTHMGEAGGGNFLYIA